MTDNQDDPVNKTLKAAADGIVPLPRFSKRKDGFTRGDVVEAFQATFEMIGGVQRMVLWANDHETEFYRLYAKLLPATTVLLGDVGAQQIIHRLRPTALDQHGSPPPQLSSPDESGVMDVEFVETQRAPNGD